LRDPLSTSLRTSYKTGTQRTIQSFLFHPDYTVRVTLHKQPWWL
jgi:hypothetical protein